MLNNNNDYAFAASQILYVPQLSGPQLSQGEHWD